MIDVTRMLSDFIAEMKFTDLPKEAVETTRMYIVDYLAACTAGYKVNVEFNEAMFEILENMGGFEGATVLFKDKTLPVENAAFMNAIYAHGADMDDGNRKAMGHVAAHVMSCVFALAETMKATWQDVFAAINAGYEVFNRLAAAAQPGLVHRGFHSTGTVGVVACGAAAAKLMGMDSEGIYNSMAIAAIQASGLIIIAESGQACKPLNPANAAKTGIISAKLTAAGVKGPIHPIESTKGWFHAMTDSVDESMITNGLGSVFTICECYLKPYPSCRHTHCGIEGAISIRKEILSKKQKVQDVKAIKVYIYRNAIQIAGQIRVPVTVDDSKFSIHYSLAIALLKGHYNLTDLGLENVNDAVMEMIDKIELIEDATMENTKAGIRGCKLVVILHDGTEYERLVTIPKGDAANPFSWEDMQQKVNGCMEGVVESEKRLAMVSKIRTMPLENIFKSVGTLIG